VKKIAKIADDISRESQGTLALIIDEFQKMGADPILIRIVSGANHGNIVLLSSHNGAISKKSYTTMASTYFGRKTLNTSDRIYDTERGGGCKGSHITSQDSDSIRLLLRDTTWIALCSDKR
jgi:hypothetical protein